MWLYRFCKSYRWARRIPARISVSVWYAYRMACLQADEDG